MGAIEGNKIVCTDTTNTIGIEEWLNETSLRVYPNPNNGKLFIESNYDVSLILMDGLGRIIVAEEIRNGVRTLDMSHYASGVYLLKATYKGETKIIKLVKND